MTTKLTKGGSAPKPKDSGMSRYAIELFGGKDLKASAKLPDGEDLNEWLAVHTVDFFNLINMLYGVVQEFCTKTACPVMSAGPKYEYHWADGTQVKTAIKVSAPEYVDYLMNWVQKQLDDESIFPSRIASLQCGTQPSPGVPYPKDFQTILKNIFKRLFRVYAHIYHSHLSKIVALGAEAHLNTCFKHFIYFVQEFQLVDSKEMAPLAEKIKALTAEDGKP